MNCSDPPHSRAQQPVLPRKHGKMRLLNKVIITLTGIKRKQKIPGGAFRQYSGAPGRGRAGSSCQDRLQQACSACTRQGGTALSGLKGKGVADPVDPLLCHTDHIKTYGFLCSPAGPVEIIERCPADASLFGRGDCLSGLPAAAADAAFYFYK